MRIGLGACVAETIERLAARPRPVGSVALENAMQAVTARLGSLGLSTGVHAFPGARWRTPSPPRLVVEGSGELPCEALIGSRDGGFSGRLGSHGTYIVWGMHRWEAYRVVEKDGRLAAHVLVRPDGPAIQQPVPVGSPAVPHLSVGRESAEALRRCAVAGGGVEGKVEADVETVSGVNVRAWRGEDGLFGDERSLLVVAHCDTVPGSPGAYDNAGGVAALLRLAELLAGGNLPDRVQLLFTSGEEQHLAGTRAFAEELQGRGKLANVAFCLNLDGTGRGRALEAWVGPGMLAERIRSALGSEETRFVSPPPPSGDHYAFWERGVPAVMLTFNDPEILHRSEDVPEPRKARNAEKMARLAADVLTEMATESD